MCVRLCVNSHVFPGVNGPGDGHSPEDDSAFDPALHEEEGSNLVDSRPSVLIREPVLLDLSREPVDRGLFESYTFTGILFMQLTDAHFLLLSTSLSLKSLFSLPPSFQEFPPLRSASGPSVWGLGPDTCWRLLPVSFATITDHLCPNVMPWNRFSTVQHEP